MPKLGMAPIRREQICRAAAQVIAQKGLDRTTLREVAEAAGVSTGSVAHYFANKEALLLEAVAFVAERFEEYLRAALDGTSGAERLSAFIRAEIGMNDETYEAWCVWLAAWSESTRSIAVKEVVRYRRDLHHRLLLEVLTEVAESTGADHGDMRDLAEEFDACLDGWALHVLTGEHALESDRAAARLMQLVEARLGLRPLPAPVS